MLVLTFLLKGGLYQRILLRCRFFLLLGALGSYCRVKLYPLSLRAFWYGGAAWSNDALSEDRDERRLLMPAGMFFVVIGGWLHIHTTSTSTSTSISCKIPQGRYASGRLALSLYEGRFEAV